MSDVPSGQAARGQVKVDLALRPEKPGLALLTATNSGSSSLTVVGWPRLSFTTTAGEPAEVVVEQVPLPQEPRPIELRPGQTAFAGVRLLVDDRIRTAAIGSVVAQLDGTEEVTVNIISTTGEPLTNTGRLKARDARIGTLQPTPEDVLVGL